MERFSRLGLLFCLGLMAGPALADRPHDDGESARQGQLWLAQMTPEQRERLRERWEHTSPEERAAIRRELRERIQDIPPEEREQIRHRLIERMQPAKQEHERLREADLPRNSFGQGYENRHERMERSALPGNRPASRGRQR